MLVIPAFGAPRNSSGQEEDHEFKTSLEGLQSEDMSLCPSNTHTKGKKYIETIV